METMLVIAGAIILLYLATNLLIRLAKREPKPPANYEKGWRDFYK